MNNNDELIYPELKIIEDKLNVVFKFVNLI